MQGREMMLLNPFKVVSTLCSHCVSRLLTNKASGWRAIAGTGETLRTIISVGCAQVWVMNDGEAERRGTDVFATVSDIYSVMSSYTT